MKPKEIKVKYEAWLSAEIMHNGSVNWLSELKFAKDEQLFFDDLVKSYTLQLIDSKLFEESKKIVKTLSTLQKETNVLINNVINHEKGLKVMVDGINHLEKENAYIVEHGELIIEVSNFMYNYRAVKSKLFALVKHVIKEGKQKRLLQ